MESFEEKWIQVYTSMIAREGGSLTALNKEQRKHLSLLMRKYELEQQSLEVDEELSQAKLPL